MEKIISGVALIAVGCALIIFRKPFTEISVGYQIWAFHMPFGVREVKISTFLAILVGSASIIGGVLVIFGIAK